MTTNLKLTLFFFLALLTFRHSANAQEGWNRTSDQGSWTYIPKDLKAGKKFYYKAYPAQQVDGNHINDWLLTNSRDLQKMLGEPLEPWKVKTDKKGNRSISNSFLDSSGKKFSVGYQAEALNDKEFFIIQMVTSQDLGMIIRYGMAYKKVKENARQIIKPGVINAAVSSKVVKEPTFSKENTPSYQQDKVTVHQLAGLRSKERRKIIEAAIRTPPGKGVKSSALEAVWVDKYIDVIIGGFRVDTYLLFKNGEAYNGCKTPPSEFNVAVSKELESASPWRKYSKWTIWRKNKNGKYEVKRNKTGQWEVLDGVRGMPGTIGEKLNNIFWSYSGSSSFGSHKSSIKLMPDGLFELSSNSIMGGDGGGTGPYTATASKSDKQGSSSSTVVVGSRVGGGSSTQKKDGSKNMGTYKINGHTIEFHHDNGMIRRELFLFEKDKHNIIIGDESYWVKKE